MATEIKDRITVTVPKRLKRRLKTVADDKGLKLNDIAIAAFNDYLDRLDAQYSSPDLVADRLAQVLVSQMAMAQELEAISMKVSELDDRL